MKILSAPYAKPQDSLEYNMSVYFIAENENDGHNSLRVKIGRSEDIQIRLRTLQIGCPYALKLMGWIESKDDKQLELSLHERYSNKRIRMEWFNLQPEMYLTN